MKPLHCGLAVLLFSAGCVKSSPAALPSPEIPHPSAPAGSPVSRSWVLVPDESLHSYASRAVTTLELQEGASALRDSLVVALDFSLRIYRASEPSRITGTVDRLQLEAGNRSPRPEQATAFPFSFSGRITSGGLTLDSAGGRTVATVADCDNAALNQMSAIQRNLFLAPLTLQAGTRWTDSSTVTTCSGTIPVELTSIRTYTVTGESQTSGGTAIAVERSERTRATGEGSQGQHRVGIQATGAGSAQLLVDPVTGLLRLMNSESRTAITVRSSGRLQQFVQIVRERTALER